MTDAPVFTVFTPTYNRAHTIHRPFESLRAQTFRDFEWIVIDDGSTDDTPELIGGWATTADFPIRYYRQDRSGRHIAHNLAVREARGSLFCSLDSDNAFLPSTLERMLAAWNSVPEAERESFAGVSGLCCDQHGDLIGDRFPASPFDSSPREIVYIHRIRGEKSGASRIKALRQYPFPEIAGTQFIPEGLIGLQMSGAYKRRYVNEIFRVYYTNEVLGRGGNLSSRSNLATTARGRLYYYVWLLNHELEHFARLPVPFLKAALMIPIVASMSGCSLRTVLGTIEPPAARMLVLLALPFASVLRVFGAASGLISGAKANTKERDSTIPP